MHKIFSFLLPLLVALPVGYFISTSPGGIGLSVLGYKSICRPSPTTDNKPPPKLCLPLLWVDYVVPNTCKTSPQLCACASEFVDAHMKELQGLREVGTIASIGSKLTSFLSSKSKFLMRTLAPSLPSCKGVLDLAKFDYLLEELQHKPHHDGAVAGEKEDTDLKNKVKAEIKQKLKPPPSLKTVLDGIFSCLTPKWQAVVVKLGLVAGVKIGLVLLLVYVLIYSVFLR